MKRATSSVSADAPDGTDLISRRSPGFAASSVFAGCGVDDAGAVGSGSSDCVGCTGAGGFEGPCCPSNQSIAGMTGISGTRIHHGPSLEFSGSLLAVDGPAVTEVDNGAWLADELLVSVGSSEVTPSSGWLVGADDVVAVAAAGVVEVAIAGGSEEGVTPAVSGTLVGSDDVDVGVADTSGVVVTAGVSVEEVTLAVSGTLVGSEDVDAAVAEVGVVDTSGVDDTVVELLVVGSGDAQLSTSLVSVSAMFSDSSPLTVTLLPPSSSSPSMLHRPWPYFTPSLFGAISLTEIFVPAGNESYPFTAMSGRSCCLYAMTPFSGVLPVAVFVCGKSKAG